MSAPNESDKFIVLPVNAQNMDTDVSTGEADALTFERLVKKILLHGVELLGVTDWAFYYVDLTRNRYLARDKLYHILTDNRLVSSPLVRKIRKTLSSAKEEKKPYIAFSLISSTLPEHLFHNLEAPIPLEEFVELLVKYAEEQDAIEYCECREVEKPEEKQTIYRMFYGSFLDALQLLRVKYTYGVANGEPCIVVDRKLNLGVIILPPSNQ